MARHPQGHAGWQGPLPTTVEEAVPQTPAPTLQGSPPITFADHGNSMIEAMLKPRENPPLFTLPPREALVARCRMYIKSLHCTLWMEWIVEDDKENPDGTVSKRGLSKASEWLADLILVILSPPKNDVSSPLDSG